MTPLKPPEPIAAKVGGAVRFAMGSPDGLRSTTWSVVGGKRDRDVYVGARGNMGETKLSLRSSGKWRLAHTAAHASRIEMDSSRVLARYTPPPPTARGWRRALTIIVPASSLRLPFPEKPAKISWWLAVPFPRAICFEVLVSDPDFDEGASFDVIGEVGRIPLIGGGGVFILANEVDYATFEPSFQQARDQGRHLIPKENREEPTLQAIAWGASDDDGHPVMHDLGNPFIE